MAQGDTECWVKREELVTESGLDAREVVTHVQWFTRGLLVHASAAARTLRFLAAGIDETEEALREEYYSEEEGVLTSEDTTSLFTLMCDLEWERHHVLLQMYDFANRYTAAYMHLTQFQKPATRRALSYLRDTELVETKGITSRLSGAGRELIEGRLLKIDPTGSFGRDDLLAFLESVWTESPVTPTRPFVHSPDYRSVTLDGRAYALPPRAAETVKLLHQRWRTGIPDVTIQEIRERFHYSENTRMRDIFGKRHEKAMNALLSVSGQGSYRLNV